MMDTEMHNQSILHKSARSLYQERIAHFSTLIGDLKRKCDTVSNIRLVIVVTAIAAAYFSFRNRSPFLFTIAIVSGGVVFALLVVYHETLHSRKCRNERLKAINKRCLDRMNGDWHAYSDDGIEFADKQHPCSNDLDIFGPRSLFQWISAAHTFYGRRKLAHNLISLPASIEELTQKQDAVKECSSLLEFRQHFEAIAMEPGIEKNPGPLLAWAEQAPSTVYLSLYYIIHIVPLFSIGLALACILLWNVPVVAYTLGAINAILNSVLFFRHKKFMDSFEKNGKLILAFSEMLSLIRKSPFASLFLVTCKELIFDTNDKRQAYQLKKLSSIIVSMEVRYNPLAHFVANVLLLWDFRVRVNAERWRARYGKQVRLWLEQIGNFEAVSSFGTVFFENSDWIFPVITGHDLQIIAEHASHPLIHESKRVYNSYTFTDNSIAIITGSNMSGKSTFLRTVGINCVLAFAGAPVCARAMSCSLMNIYSSMRIEDNLADSVSTFYAELMRIKMVIKANNEGIPLLCLLDELFRGTNSEDRHDGAVAVLKRLRNTNTIGIISTHDLQLCSLSEESPGSFVNYHFKEYYDGKKIRFDYKINSGPSTTRNALFLLKMLEIV